MKLNQDVSRPGSIFGATLVLWFCLQPLFANAQPASSVVLWDTGTKASGPINLEHRSGWKVVPSDLLTLEANPPKASSDPGYYGREYSFKGDAVVENQKVIAVFWSSTGRMSLFAKQEGSHGDGSARADTETPVTILELFPSAEMSKGGAAPFEIVRNADDQVILQVTYAEASNDCASFSFERSAIMEVKPSANLKGFTIVAPIEYGIVPSFIGDDLIYGAQEKEPDAGNILSLPSENIFVGLLKGEATQFVMTWPKGRQQIRLGLGEESDGRRRIESIQFQNDGQGFYLASMAAAGIWHRELLTPALLEKDVAIGWKKPFSARWKTELYEETVKTTFAFKQTKGDVWRGVPGSYDYPVWFDGEQAFYHLSKKVPPKGESVIYFLEGQGTPAAIQTPVDILNATLGRPMADPILDVAGRKLRTHHRRGGDGVHRACTCGCTEAIQAVFESGDEVARKDDIKGDLEDMLYFVHHHVDRINEYRRFADEMISYIKAKKSAAPDLGEYLDSLEQIIGQIPQECTVQQENMKSFTYADELVNRTMALTGKKDPGNLKAYMDLLKEWRAMGGAQDYVLAQCHIITRKLAQEAGYGCAGRPNATAVAEGIRMHARQCLRNPDGYEIWADY